MSLRLRLKAQARIAIIAATKMNCQLTIVNYQLTIYNLRGCNSFFQDKIHSQATAA
jgi:hypothetical protein